MIKVGILGTGFGETHLGLYKETEGFEVVSVFGRNEEKLKGIGEKYNVPISTDIGEIIHNPAIDLVDICLPTDLHSSWAIEGLKHGKHIFCETPVAHTVDEAVAIKQAADKYGKNVFVNLFIKFSEPHRIAVEMVKNEDYGRLLGIRTYNKTSPRWGDMGLKNNVVNFHNHMMDFAIGFTGLPRSVAASGMDYGGKSSVVTSSYVHKDVYAVLESNSALPHCRPFEIGFELLCDDGIIKFDALYGDYTKEELSVVGNSKPFEIFRCEDKNDYAEAIKHIRHCMINNIKSEVIDIEHAILSVKYKEMVLNFLKL
jgi:predicted dehydrogenase